MNPGSPLTPEGPALCLWCGCRSSACDRFHTRKCCPDCDHRPWPASLPLKSQNLESESQ